MPEEKPDEPKPKKLRPMPQARPAAAPAMRGERGSDDADIWLRLYESAIAAGKAPEAAVGVADAGARAFKTRFRLTAPEG